MEQGCLCNSGPKLIFSCSGAADTAEIADRTARRLTKEGVGKMYCLAGIGGRVPGILETTQSASKILAMDGCDKDCARKSLELAGFASVTHLRLTDFGLVKGESPPTHERITLVVDRAKALLEE